MTGVTDGLRVAAMKVNVKSNPYLLWAWKLLYYSAYLESGGDPSEFGAFVAWECYRRRIK